MAKSKNGGSRAYIRGRIGSDVYSIGRNGKGDRQQVVRSLAESVANPRTESQMSGRMIMSTVMQAVSALSPIIDHSFDGFPKGQPSISEFIRRNYALVKADAAAHPQQDNYFGLNKYQEKGIKPGLYIVSDGTIVKPSAVTFTANKIAIALTADTLTVGGLKAALGLSADGFLTSVCISTGNGVAFFRAKLDTTLADATAISAENVGDLFSFEGNVAVTASLSNNTIELSAGAVAGDHAYGGIVSEKVDGNWKHSACTLAGIGDYNFAASAALPTSPTGAEQYLNGGDL